MYVFDWAQGEWKVPFEFYRRGIWIFSSFKYFGEDNWIKENKVIKYVYLVFNDEL